MQIICGQCGQRHDFDEPPAGGEIACAGCGRTICLNGSPEASPAGGEPASGPSDLDEGFAAQARQSLRKRMFIVCASCGLRIKVTRRLAGSVVRCESCSQSIRVPSMDDDDQVELVGADASLDPNQAVHDLQKVVSPGEHLVHSSRANTWAGKAAFWLALAGLVAAVVLAAVWLWPNIRDDGASLESARPGQSQAAATPVEVPAMKVLSAKWSVFAAGGYIPARPGRLYYKLPVEIRAGDKPIIFDGNGAEARLTAGEDSFASLGLADDPADARKLPQPQLPKPGPVHVRPGEQKTITFLFDLPGNLRQARLRVGDFEPVAMTLLPPPKPGQELVGRYVELPPRNCRPLLNGPVMAAVQAQPNHILDVRYKNGEPGTLAIAIPAAGVTGRGHLIGDDMYGLTLRADRKILLCQLRQIDSERVILYLSDQPMHQITYHRVRTRKKNH